MKHKLALLLAVILCGGALVPTNSEAVGISISIGDRPYYNRGPYYWDSGVRWYWAPGHWVWRRHHRIWVHGYYSPHRVHRYY